MARITHVKSAQQRYATVPVIDPETGQQKRTPVMRKDGTQKTSKRGPVFLRVTKADKTKPLAPLRCDFPACDEGGVILPGQGYKHISPKSGPYGGRQLSRHASHPSWNVWDYSSSLPAQAQRVAHDAHEAIDNADTTEDVQSALEEAASQIRDDLAEQRRESAQNIEDGFGHETYQSTQLNEDADALDDWADEVESADVPDLEDSEFDLECGTCAGAGTVENDDFDPEDEESDEPEENECEDCGGEGTDPNERDVDAWREAVNEAVAMLDECPV